MLADDQALNYNDLRVKPTQDWTVYHTVFNSLTHDKVNIYFGCWDGRSGSVWYADPQLEEVGLLNVVRRPGAPLTTTFCAGRSRIYVTRRCRWRCARSIASSRSRSSESTPVANSVVFEYGGRCYRFGAGLSEEEVLRMVRTIRDRFRIKDHVDDVEPLPVLR